MAPRKRFRIIRLTAIGQGERHFDGPEKRRKRSTPGMFSDEYCIHRSAGTCTGVDFCGLCQSADMFFLDSWPVREFASIEVCFARHLIEGTVTGLCFSHKLYNTLWFVSLIIGGRRLDTPNLRAKECVSLVTRHPQYLISHCRWLKLSHWLSTSILTLWTCFTVNEVSRFTNMVQINCPRSRGCWSGRRTHFGKCTFGNPRKLEAFENMRRNYPIPRTRGPGVR